MKPKRIQLSRRKGWRLPANTVVVSRGPGRFFGNPHRVTPRLVEQCGDEQTAAAAVVMAYREFINETPQGREIAARARRELRGKNLACWCSANLPCHADVLLEIANKHK